MQLVPTQHNPIGDPADEVHIDMAAGTLEMVDFAVVGSRVDIAAGGFERTHHLL